MIFPNAPIWVDFNGTDGVGHLYLSDPGTRGDLEEQGIVLHEGLELFAYDVDGDANDCYDDIITWGVVTWNEKADSWVLDKWMERLTHSDLDAESQASYRQHRPQMGTPIQRPPRTISVHFTGGTVGARQLAIDGVLDRNLEGEPVGIEVLFLASQAALPREVFRNLSSDAARVSYDESVDALGVKLAEGPSSTQTNVTVSLVFDQDDRLVSMLVLMP